MSIMIRWIRCRGVRRRGDWVGGCWEGAGCFLGACLVLVFSSASPDLEFWDATVC